MSTVITVETLFGASNTDILDVLNGEGEAAAAAALAAASANAKPMPAIHAKPALGTWTVKHWRVLCRPAGPIR